MIKANRFFTVKLIFLLSGIIFPLLSFAQKSEEKETIHWLTFDQLKDSMASNPKKIFIEIYTDWCGPCKIMEKKVFPKKKVVEPMNDYYYAVRLNSETMDSISFNGNDYFLTLHKTTKINELVLEIGLEAGHLSYPTMVILNENYEVIYRYPGSLTADLLMDDLETWK
jgi:thioredoxin-related protein